MFVYMHTYTFLNIDFKLKKLTSEEKSCLLEKYILKLWASPISAVISTVFLVAITNAFCPEFSDYIDSILYVKQAKSEC